MQKTLPSPNPPKADPQQHPDWCSREHSDDPSHHRSHPREIVSEYGVVTTIRLEHYEMPYRTYATVDIQQTGECECPEPNNHEVDPCHEPTFVGFRLNEARQLVAHLLGLIEGTEA